MRRSGTAGLVSWIVGAASAVGGAASGPTVLLASGETRNPVEVVVDPGTGVTLLLAGGGQETVPLASVALIQFPPQDGRQRGAGPAALHLHDGSLLFGELTSGDDDGVDWTIQSGPRVRFSLDAIRALVFGERTPYLQPEDFRRSGMAQDYLFRRAEAGGDFTSGTFLRSTEAGIQFEYSLGEKLFPFGEIEAVLLAPQVDLPPPEGPVVTADLWPDGSLRGTLVRYVEGDLTLVPLFGRKEVRLPVALLRGMRFPGTTFEWLSDRPPAEVRQVPFLGSAEDFLYPFRKDRSVTGGPLQVAGARFAKGLGCHSRTELHYGLEGLGFRQFLVEVGISDEVLALPHRGSVEFAVRVDGREVFRSAAPMQAGDRAVRIGPIELSGAHRLTLLTDFGAAEDIADRAVWGNAILLR